MIDQDPNNTTKDYTGAGGGADVDTPAIIGSEEELAKLFEQQGNVVAPDDDDDSQTDTGDEPQVTDDDSDPQPGAKKKDDGTDDTGEPDDDDVIEYASPIHYLDDRFKLGLNLENYPTDTPPEDAMQAVGDMFERVVKNANARILEYKTTVDALEDAEVKAFIEAKKAGKTMRDFVQEYSVTPDGMADEAIVRQDLARQYPKFSEEKIEDLLSSYRDRDMVEEMAGNIRDRWKAAEEAKQAEDAKRAEQEAKAEQERRSQEIANYTSFVGNKADVFGIPLSDDMKQEIIAAATQPMDENGNTFLDRALQSDEGVLLATLGILHLERMLKAKNTTVSNRQKKSLLDRLYEDPDALQSSGTRDRTSDDFNADVANQW